MKLSENDYLVHQLYTASKAPRVKKSRIRGWIMTTVSFLALAYIFSTTDNDHLTLYFVFASVLSLILYPTYSRWRYKEHYKQYVKEVYKTRFNEETELEITEDFIQIKDRTGIAQINTSEIEEINEIKGFIFIKLITGASVVISKSSSDAREVEAIENSLMTLMKKKSIKYNKELDWRWR